MSIKCIALIIAATNIYEEALGMRLSASRDLEMWTWRGCVYQYTTPGLDNSYTIGTAVTKATTNELLSSHTCSRSLCMSIGRR